MSQSSETLTHSPSSAQRPSKRRRSSSELVTQFGGPVTRSELFWIDDGNIILEADGIQFRVHRSMLSRESSVFQGMFTVPQPPNKPQIEGCPVVHLSDSGRDVECFLKAIYDGRWFHGEPRIKIADITRILRMGRKYDCPRFRRDVLKRFSTDFPNSSLAEWEQVSDKSFSAFEDDDGLRLDVLELAREYGFDSILPIVYYDCISFYTVQNILDGDPRDDQTLATLSPDVQAMCLAGVHKLRQALLKHTFKWLSGPYALTPLSNACSQPKRCRFRTAVLATKLLADSPQTIAGLNSWAKWANNIGESEKLCDPCWHEAQLSYEEGRETLWNALPSLFGLPTWDELKNDA